MSDHTFKTNFLDLSEDTGSLQTRYDSPANVRNVVFVLSNGTEVMRNYAYLVGVDLIKSDEQNLLEIRFTSDKILIEGYRLFHLRDLFLSHFPKVVMFNNCRYNLVNESEFWIKNLSQVT